MATVTNRLLALWAFEKDPSTGYAIPLEGTASALPSWAAITNATFLGALPPGVLVTDTEPVRDVLGRLDRVKITIEGHDYITDYSVIETVEETNVRRTLATVLQASEQDKSRA